jgi:hypothetical protein
MCKSAPLRLRCTPLAGTGGVVSEMRALFVPMASRMLAKTALEWSVQNAIEQGLTPEEIQHEIDCALGVDEEN